MTAYLYVLLVTVACGAALWRCRARYCTPGGAAAQLRTRPASRTLACVLCVELAVAGLMARGAYADAYQVAWNTDSDGTQWCFVVSPDNEFDATLYALGLGMYPLTNDQRAYLSSAQYGGMFYTVSQRWAPIQHYLSEYEGSSLFTQFLAFVMDTPLMQVTYNVMGMDAYTNVWTATISDAEKEQAKQDFSDVVNGNIGGGGGGNVEDENYYIFTGNSRFSSISGNRPSGIYYDVNGTRLTYDIKLLTTLNTENLYESFPQTYTIKLKKTLVPEIFASQHENENWTINLSLSEGNISRLTVYTGTPTYGTNNNAYSSLDYINGINNINGTCYTTNSVQSSYSNNTFVIDGPNLSRTNDTGSVSIANTSFTASTIYEGTTPTPPENDWPGDDNDQPTAPQLPVINIPGITLPSLPSITLDPTINVNVSDPTNTSPTDYTPWLKAIKDTLTDGFDNLYDELSEHCYHLQEQMQHQAVYVADSITDYMEECITTLVTDMQAIARYIVDSLTYYFGNGSYNDNNVIFWLKRIWMRLGGGSPSPVNEPDDAWDWFTKLITGLLADIMAAGSDLAADVAELISQVMTKFPFSIPWDIAAILGLFAATPVTPHFEVPINVPNVVSTNIVVDLGFLDAAMSTVRAIELIGFAVYLLWITKDIVKIFDETGFI